MSGIGGCRTVARREPALFLDGVGSHFGSLRTMSRHSKEETMDVRIVFIILTSECKHGLGSYGNTGKP